MDEETNSSSNCVNAATRLIYSTDLGLNPAETVFNVIPLITNILLFLDLPSIINMFHTCKDMLRSAEETTLWYSLCTRYCPLDLTTLCSLRSNLHVTNLVPTHSSISDKMEISDPYQTNEEVSKSVDSEEVTIKMEALRCLVLRNVNALCTSCKKYYGSFRTQFMCTGCRAAQIWETMTPENWANIEPVEVFDFSPQSRKRKRLFCQSQGTIGIGHKRKRMRRQSASSPSLSISSLKSPVHKLDHISNAMKKEILFEKRRAFYSTLPQSDKVFNERLTHFRQLLTCHIPYTNSNSKDDQDTKRNPPSSSLSSNDSLDDKKGIDSSNREMGSRSSDYNAPSYLHFCRLYLYILRSKLHEYFDSDDEEEPTRQVDSIWQETPFQTRYEPNYETPPEIMNFFDRQIVQICRLLCAQQGRSENNDGNTCPANEHTGETSTNLVKIMKSNIDLLLGPSTSFSSKLPSDNWEKAIGLRAIHYFGAVDIWENKADPNQDAKQHYNPSSAFVGRKSPSRPYLPPAEDAPPITYCQYKKLLSCLTSHQNNSLMIAPLALATLAKPLDIDLVQTGSQLHGVSDMFSDDLGKALSHGTLPPPPPSSSSSSSLSSSRLSTLQAQLPHNCSIQGLQREVDSNFICNQDSTFSDLLRSKGFRISRKDCENKELKAAEMIGSSLPKTLDVMWWVQGIYRQKLLSLVECEELWRTAPCIHDGKTHRLNSLLYLDQLRKPLNIDYRWHAKYLLHLTIRTGPYYSNEVERKNMFQSKEALFDHTCWHNLMENQGYRTYLKNETGPMCYCRKWGCGAKGSVLCHLLPWLSRVAPPNSPMSDIIARRYSVYWHIIDLLVAENIKCAKFRDTWRPHEWSIPSDESSSPSPSSSSSSSSSSLSSSPLSFASSSSSASSSLRISIHELLSRKAPYDRPSSLAKTTNVPKHIRNALDLDRGLHFQILFSCLYYSC